jgi:hypothetical protein
LLIRSANKSSLSVGKPNLKQHLRKLKNWTMLQKRRVQEKVMRRKKPKKGAEEKPAGIQLGRGCR